MPKEYINHPDRLIIVTDPSGNYVDHRSGDPIPAGYNVTTNPAAFVGWAGDSGGNTVQLGIDLDMAYLRRVVEEGDGVGMFTIYTPTLSRAEVNGAIRLLRRARNAAYGVDE